MADEKQYKYRVKAGYTHGINDQYKAGDVVELTETEAAPFLDKLEPVGKGQETEQQATIPAGADLPTLATTEKKGK